MSAPAVDVWRVSAALQRAQLQATLDRLDAGAGNAKLLLYSSARTENGVATTAPMADIGLAKPSGSIDVDGFLSLLPADAGGVMVLTSGIPRWAQLLSADGVVLLDGGVTDANHDGCFQVSGGVTPPGDNSPMFYAGALLLLAPAVLS